MVEAQPTEPSKAERKRIARELGIDLEDLSLRPNERDLAKVNTPARAHIKSTQL